jgi:5S rRNA maturation endonuclease (ribonuclease M5)
MNKKLETQILEKFLRMAVGRFDTSIIRDTEIQINCNICGDSENKNKLRGHLKLGQSEDFWFYKCFNAGCPASDTWSARRWLKETDLSIFKLYCKESFEYDEVKNKHILPVTVATKVREIPKDTEIDEYLKDFRPIDHSNDMIFRKAIHQCKQRHIPEKIYKKFMVAVDGPYYDRMIIPFYDHNNKMYYFQARTLSNKEPKYLNMKGKKEFALYNLYNIDKSKPVIITEGPIDSMFIDNAIATLGLEMSKHMKKTLSNLDCYYLFDNDEPGKKFARKFHLNGKKVFIWEKFKYYDKKIKDINDVVKNNEVKHFSFDDLKDCFENSYGDYRYYFGDK